MLNLIPGPLHVPSATPLVRVGFRPLPLRRTQSRTRSYSTSLLVVFPHSLTHSLTSCPLQECVVRRAAAPSRMLLRAAPRGNHPAQPGRRTWGRSGLKAAGRAGALDWTDRAAGQIWIGRTGPPTSLPPYPLVTPIPTLPPYRITNTRFRLSYRPPVPTSSGSIES